MEPEGSVEMIDLDLNEEPTMEPTGNYSGNMESVYTRIEERIRLLEAVTQRARHRQEWRLATEAVNEEPLGLNGESELAVVDDVPREALSTVPETGLDGLKRSDSHLLALALELEGEARDNKNSREAFFDCNKCVKKAREPILTCCGHLYCWPCFYQLPDVVTDTKECPECKGEVKSAGITPIYGSSEKTPKRNVDGCGGKIPPRPQAHRVESLRQQRITRGSSASRIEEVLRGLRNFSTLSRNLSLALSSAERIVEDLEGMAHMYPSAGHRYRVVFDPDINSHIVVPVPSEAPDADDEIDAALPSSSTSAVANGTTSANNSVQPDPAASLPRRIIPRRRIHSQGHFTNVAVGMQPRSSLRSRNEQREQLRSILRGRAEQQAPTLQDLSRVQHPPEIDSPDLLPVRLVRVVTAHPSLADSLDGTVSAMPETSVTARPSTFRRRTDSSEASGSGTPEPRRRRLR